VLVTGAFGNVGRHVVRELLARGHRVRAFDQLRTPSRAQRRELAGRVELCWGDMRDAEAIARAVEGQDDVIHLAFVLPPSSERRPAEARDVNVEGASRLIAAMRALASPPRLLFASSYAVHGDTLEVEEPLGPDSPTAPLNAYTEHKVEVERLVRGSGLAWCIVRLGAVLSTESVLGGTIDPLIFDLPTRAKQEFVHSDDVALALARILEVPEAWGRVLMIGGGPSCQVRYGDLINRSLHALGIGALPAEAFSAVARQGGGWMDTRESQRLLGYQRWTFDAHLDDLAARAGVRRWAARALDPVIRWHIVRRSPYLKRTAC
jgi:nucleoside-diphosphate-sugar epimerase